MESMKTHGLARRRRSNHGAPRFPTNHHHHHHHHHPNLYPYREFQMENGTQKGKPISGWNYQSDDRSPTSRALAIAKRQQDLMKMVQAMPESDFELTLRDLVVVDVTKMEKSDDGEGGRVMIVEEKMEGKMKRKVPSDFSLVKMILSINLGGRKRGGSVRTGSKVSPKNLPSLSDGGKSSDKGSRGSSHGMRGMTGCWSFYHKKTEMNEGER